MKNNPLLGARAVWFLVLITTSAVNAGDNSTWVYTPGEGSCGELDRPQSEFMSRELQDWMLGYVSGLATSGTFPKNILKTTSIKGAFSWVDNYCKIHPLDKLGAAGIALMQELVNRSKNSN